MAEEPAGEFTDVESLLKTSATKMVEQAQAKLEKGSKVRDILEDRAMTFQERAKQFVLGELNTTASSLLRAIEADEATILLDFNQAVDASFPPVPVLIAGMVSPSILALSMTSHVLQLVFLFLPIFVFSGWATYTDYGAVCSIPTMIAWNYTACVLSLFLTLGHLFVAIQINSGKAALKAKSEEISARLAHNAADGETDFSDMQEIFIGGSVLVQQALLVEDSVRRSFWYHILGIGTTIWLFVSIWNAVIVIGWTFVPGTIAFHEKAHMAPDYCGAWASVFTARVVCIIMPMFFFINVLSVVDWVVKSLINSSGFASAVLAAAEQADAGMMGLPIVQYLVKAFVLRGSTDTAKAKLTVALSEKVRLQREHAEVAAELDAMEAKIKVSKKATKSLKKKADSLGGTGLDAMLTQLKAVESLDTEQWKDEGVKLVEQATAEAMAAKEAATEELDKIAEMIMEIVDQIQKSETVQSAISQAKDAAEKAKSAADEGMKQAQAAAETGMAQASAAAAQAQVAAQQGMAQASAAAQQGMAQASQAASAAAPLLEQQAKEVREAAEQRRKGFFG